MGEPRGLNGSFPVVEYERYVYESARWAYLEAMATVSIWRRIWWRTLDLLRGGMTEPRSVQLTRQYQENQREQARRESVRAASRAVKLPDGSPILSLGGLVDRFGKPYRR